MKKFLLKVSIFTVYAFIIQVIFPIAVDPFNVFHADNIRPNGVISNSNYIKTRYVLKNPKKFECFLFGSSRVGAIHVDKIREEKCYNMTYSMGMISEHMDNIKTFFANGIRPSKIYIGFDDISLTGKVNERIMSSVYCPYEYIVKNPVHFYSLYLSTKSALFSLPIILSYSGSRDNKIFYEYGWEIAYNRKGMNRDKWTLGYGPKGKLIDNSVAIERTLRDIQEIVDICHKYGTELVMFTNPMYCITYMGAVERNYLTFLEGVAKITNFYNFSGINDITTNDNNYLEDSHYKAEIGDVIIDVICNGKSYPELQHQGFGVKVTRENVKEFVAMLRSQAEDFRTE